MNKSNKKYLCTSCKKRYGKEHYGWLCGFCYRRGRVTMPMFRGEGEKLKTALEKVRTVYPRRNVGKYIDGVLYLPECLVSRKVKVVLVEDEK